MSALSAIDVRVRKLAVMRDRLAPPNELPLFKWADEVERADDINTTMQKISDRMREMMA